MVRSRNSRASQSTVIPYDIDFEAQKIDGEAALCLSSFKIQKLDCQTGKDLYNMKKEILENYKTNWARNSVSRICTINHDKAPRSSEPPCRDDAVQNCSKGFKWPEIGTGADGIVLPELPPVKCLEGLIGKCSKPFEKQLTKSDLKKSQNRLKLCTDYVKSALIPMLNPEDNLLDGISVTVYDSDGKEYAMKFKCWKNAHVLTEKWNDFVKNYPIGLQENTDWITVWIFRYSVKDKLGFAITSRRLPTDDLLRKSRTKSRQGKRERKSPINHQEMKEIILKEEENAG